MIDLFTGKQLLCFGYNAVLKTRCFVDGIKSWRNKSKREKPYALFKAYMIDKYKDYLEDMASNANNQYQGSNIIQDKALETLHKITNSITHDCQQILKGFEANFVLSTATSTSKEEIKTLTDQIKNLQQKMTDIEKRMVALEGKKRGRPNTTPASSATLNLSKYKGTYTRHPK